MFNIKKKVTLTMMDVSGSTRNILMTNFTAFFCLMFFNEGTIDTSSLSNVKHFNTFDITIFDNPSYNNNYVYIDASSIEKKNDKIFGKIVVVADNFHFNSKEVKKKKITPHCLIEE